MNTAIIFLLLSAVAGPIAVEESPLDKVPVKEEVQVTTPKEITGKQTQPQVVLPAKSLAVFAVSAEAPTLEDGVVITVSNRIQVKGGKWEEAGKFTCSPPPWFDKTKCEVIFTWTDPKGNPIPFPDGTLMESDIETKDKACAPEVKGCVANDKKGTVGLKYTIGKSL